ncbi:hypothetical protein [Absidia glauca]|uniref:DNA polymerase n=1 Tax=Absidia glauca TaxID=4829 RepID=A0A168NYM3_ABSGL|nr:hypothetical protein [Absidia glauca]
MFKQQAFYIINEKLESSKVGAMAQIVEKNGGEMAKNQHSADIVLTALKSSARIKRHLKNRKIPVLDIQWLMDCAKKKKQIPIDDYRLLADDKPEAAHSKSDSKTDDKPEATHSKSGSKTDDYIPNDDEEDAESNDIDPSFNNTRYECLRNTPLKPKHNGKLLAYLRLLEKSRQLDMNNMNSLAYRHAISAIKSYPRKLRSDKEAGKILGIGSKIRATIKIYLETGTVPEAEALLADNRFRTLKLFNKCFGPSTAIAWWDMGYRSLQQVLDQGSLTHSVRLGIQLLPDFILPLERGDVEELIGIIEKNVKQLNEQLLVTPVGGYRRGKQKSGDLDIIVSSVQAMDMSDILPTLLDRLASQGYIKHVLWKSLKGASTLKDRDRKQKGADQHDNDYYIINKSSRRSGFDDLAKAFTCFMQPSKGIGRQVDFIVATFDEYPTALLGWTGSRQFERSIKDYAKKEKNIKIKSNEMITRSIPEKRLIVRNEKDIFEALGIPFVPPHCRNC